LGAILCAALVRKLTIEVMRRALLETLMTSASLFIIGIGAAMFTRFPGDHRAVGVPVGMGQRGGIGYYQLMLIIVIIYLLLGMVMEPFGAHCWSRCR
jgi:TRAP-type C4-dicarboxylate transport system permease large subunit